MVFLSTLPMKILDSGFQNTITNPRFTWKHVYILRIKGNTLISNVEDI